MTLWRVGAMIRLATIVLAMAVQSPATWTRGAPPPVAWSTPAAAESQPAAKPPAARPETPYAAACSSARQGRIMVVLIGADWCEPCVRMRRELADALESRDDAVFAYLASNSRSGRANSRGTSIPQVIVARHSAGRWKSWHATGYQAPAVVVGQIEPAKRGWPAPPVRVGYRTAPIRYGGQSWTLPNNAPLTRGNLINHLSGPNHGHDRRWLETLSTGQLRALHNTDHNTNRQPAARSRRVVYRR